MSTKPVGLYALDNAQHATVLAALRFYQQEGLRDRATRFPLINEIANNCGTVKPLRSTEIDDLCMQINDNGVSLPYVRLTKRWSRNSGFADYKWLWYVDLVSPAGESAEKVGVKCHEYGMSEDRARKLAASIAGFFNWTIQEFEEQRVTEVTLVPRQFPHVHPLNKDPIE